MGKLVLYPAEIAILQTMTVDNPMGRAGWPLQHWESQVRPACARLIKNKFVVERRLGGYPGLEITSAGRLALAQEDEKK